MTKRMTIFGDAGKYEIKRQLKTAFITFIIKSTICRFFPFLRVFPSETRISCLSVTKKNRTKLKGLKRLTYYFSDDFF